MKTSENITNIAKALLAVQHDLKPIPKDSVNPHFKNQYSDLQTVIATIAPILNKHGIIYVQGGDGNNLVTKLIHCESGEWIETVIPLMPSRQDPQGLMSAITYARRYGLTSICGAVSGDEDDDGNKASEKSVTYATKEQIDEFYSLGDRLGLTTQQLRAGLARYGIQDIEDASFDTAKSIIDAMRSKIK